jgi:hypothetical protein
MAPARQLTSSASLKGKGSRETDSWQSEAPRRAGDASFGSKKLNKTNNVTCEWRESSVVKWRSFARLSCAAFAMGLPRTIVGNLSGYVEFYDAVGSGPWIGTLDTGLIY